MTTASPDLFETLLAAPVEDIDLPLTGHPPLPWSPFALNTHRLVGSDFLTRWNQRVWAQRRVIDAVNRTGDFRALPYGPRSAAPADYPRETERYLERLDTANRTAIERPDILIFRRSAAAEVDQLVRDAGGAPELPFRDESEDRMRRLMSLAVVAVACQHSPRLARKMPAYGEPPRPLKRLEGRKGLPKGAVLPTIILKHEDLDRLLDWETDARLPIHIWHLFHDLAFGISLREASRLISTGNIEPTQQTFQAPGGSTNRKPIYKIYHHYAYAAGEIVEEPQLVADAITDKNGHILPFVRFEGSRLDLDPSVIELLEGLAE